MTACCDVTVVHLYNFKNIREHIKIYKTTEQNLFESLKHKWHKIITKTNKTTKTTEKKKIEPLKYKRHKRITKTNNTTKEIKRTKPKKTIPKWV